MASESSDKKYDSTRVAAENLEQVKRSVIRTIVDEVRKELDSAERAIWHAKADTHKKFDYYVKGLPTAQL